MVATKVAKCLCSFSPPFAINVRAFQPQLRMYLVGSYVSQMLPHMGGRMHEDHHETQDWAFSISHIVDMLKVIYIHFVFCHSIGSHKEIHIISEVCYFESLFHNLTHGVANCGTYATVRLSSHSRLTLYARVGHHLQSPMQYCRPWTTNQLVSPS